MKNQGTCLVFVAIALAFACAEGEPPLARSKEGLRLEPEALLFGDVFTESNVLRRARVRNNGNVSLSLRAASAPPSFDVSPLHLLLEPGEEEDVEIRFRPLQAGSVRGAISFRSAKGGEWRLPVEGNAIPIVLSLPASVDFGAVRTGASLSRDVSIESLSDAPLDLHIQRMGAPAFRFERVQRTLPARGALDLPVEFSPIHGGETEGWLSVQPCPDCAGQLIRLRGVGLAHRLQPLPDPVDFGQVPPGTTGTARLLVENRGNLAARIGALALEGKGLDVFGIQGPPVPATLEAGESLAWNLSFSPKEEGEARARLHFRDPDGVSLLEVSVQGLAAGPYLHAGPLQLGTTLVDTPSSHDLRIERRGQAGTITIEDFRFEGPDAGDFRIQGAKLPLAVNEDIEVEVVYEAREPGAVQASLRIVTSYVGQPELVVPIAGVAVESDCEIEANVDALRFGLVAGARSHQRRIELRHVGDESCLLLQVGLEQQAPDFRLVGAPAGPHLLGPGERLHFFVELAPAPSWSGRTEGSVTWSWRPDEPPAKIPVSAYRADPMPLEVDPEIFLVDTPVGRLSFAALHLEAKGALQGPVVVRLVPGSSAGIEFETWTGTVGWSTAREVRFAPREAGPHAGAIEVLVPGYPEAIRVALRGRAPEECGTPCQWPELRCSAPGQVVVGEEALLSSGLEELPTDHTSCFWATKVRDTRARFTPTTLCNARFTPSEEGVFDLILRVQTESIGAECELTIEAVEPPEDDP